MRAGSGSTKRVNERTSGWARDHGGGEGGSARGAALIRHPGPHAWADTGTPVERGAPRRAVGIFAGIFSAMSGYPSPDDVLAALGDKVVAALFKAADQAKEDLAGYREEMPQYVAESSNRGLANWIHDRMWARLVAELMDVEGVELVDAEPVREIRTRGLCVRLKRHTPTGGIRAYPTASARSFIAQPVEADLLSLLVEPWSELPYGQTLNLTAGYEWDQTSRSMGEAVLSLRDGSFDDVVWMVALPTPGTGGGTTITPMAPPSDGPTTPSVEMRHNEDTAEGAGDA